MTPPRIIAAAVIGVIVAAAVITDTWVAAALAVVATSFVLFALASPRMALFVWLLTAPVANAYATVSLPLGVPDITFGRVVVAVVSIGLLLQVMLKGRRLAPFGAVELSMLALMGIMVADLLARSGRPTSDFLQNFDEQITPILIFLAVRNLFVRRTDLKAAVVILTIVGSYLALHGAFQYFGLGSANSTTGAIVERSTHEGGMRVDESHLAEGRAVGPFSSAVEFGSVTAITLVAALYVALYLTRGVSRVLSLAAVPLSAAAVLFSSTRSTWLGAFLGVTLLALLDRQRRVWMLTTIGALSVGVLAAIVLVPDRSFLVERASSTEPIQARMLMYEVGLRIAVRHPLVGYGRGIPARLAARKELLELRSPEADLAPGQFHNIFLSILVEWGVLGLAAYLAMLGGIVKGTLELRRRLATQHDFVYYFCGFFLSTALIFVVQCLFVDTPAYLYLNGVFSFLAGLVFAQLDATAPAREVAASAYYGRVVSPDGSRGLA